MSSRFGRDSARSALFDGYDKRASSRSGTSTPQRAGGNGTPIGNPYSHSYGYSAPPSGNYSSAYPTSNSSPQSNAANNPYHSAAPNRKGQYSDAVLDELESQNDREVEGMSARVRMLKDLTTAIGDEIRDSSALADKMNDQFENARARLGGTMNRMLAMAKKTGIGWRAWLAFFAAVSLLFWYVWLF